MAANKQPVLAYLEALHTVRGTGKATAEQSYKSKLETLLTAIGKEFDPELHATMELKGEGAGRPDLGLFEKKSGNLRLVVEVKSPKDNIYDTANGEQVAKYWKHYGYVLVTNFREFVFVARDARTGQACVEARYQMSPASESFEKANPASLAKQHEQGLTDFLQGIFARPSPILKPKELAADLARHAREAKRRLGWHSADALRPLQEAFESALGLTFEEEKGLNFFRSSLVQTLFYGLFSGWMLWRQSQPKGRALPEFHWKDASDFLALPLIGDLFDEVAKPKRLTELDLREPIEWAAASLNRVAHEEFFRSFDADHAITLFYEPFLAEFDPELRKQLGVWYTPPEVVKYMVGRVDQLLRSELGIADGLADESVYVLDPATGTGSYLVEVARRIHRTLEENGAGGLAAAGVKKALTTRVFGFEILPAPYVVAHLQLGVLLKSLGSALTSKEHTGVYLTNALTGWEPPKGAKRSLAFPFLQEEQDRASKVKLEAPVLVILGNPPYDGYAGVSQKDERDLSTAYKTAKRGPKPEGQGNNDLYVRFFRMAERRIVHGMPHTGIVCYISNYRWLDSLSGPAMREKYLEDFDAVYIDCLNGDKFKNGKLTPDGKPDPSVFSTEANREGIETGTAIATLVRKAAHTPARAVFFRNFWGRTKREDVLGSLSHELPKDHELFQPPWELGYPFLPGTFHPDFLSWPSVEELMPVSFPGVTTSRDSALVGYIRESVEERLRVYFDKGASAEQLLAVVPALLAKTKRFDPAPTRDRLVKLGMSTGRLCRYAYRPFDERWLYWHPETKLLDEKRREFTQQSFDGNLFLFTTGRTRKDRVEAAFVTRHLTDYNMMDSGARGFPLMLRADPDTLLPSLRDDKSRVNLSEAAFAYLDENRAPDDSLFFHILAITNSPAYRDGNIGALRHSWPRVPLPGSSAILARSASLGRQLGDLLLPDKPVPGVTTGKLLPELKSLAVPHKVSGESIDPEKDLEVTASWGYFGVENAVMPGHGKVTPNEADPAGAVDIWINEAVCWRDVPRSVWEMTIGGYPVVKKWLSYRDKRVLGRALKLDEVVYVTQMVRRLAAVLALSDELDINYVACSKDTVKLR